MCNCDKERYDLSLYATTASLWAHLIAEKERFINPEYVFTKQVGSTHTHNHVNYHTLVLLLSLSLFLSLSLSLQAIFPITNIRRLRLWEEYFLRYDFTTYTLRGGRQVEDNTADHSPSVIVSQPTRVIRYIIHDCIPLLPNDLYILLHTCGEYIGMGEKGSSLILY